MNNQSPDKEVTEVMLKSKEHILEKNLEPWMETDMNDAMTPYIYKAMEEFGKIQFKAGYEHCLHKPDYSNIQSLPKEQGIRWIKVSEDSLPENPDLLVCGRWDGGGCDHYETCDTEMLLDAMKSGREGEIKFDVYWLYEPESTQVKEQGKWTNEQVRTILMSVVGMKRAEELISEYKNQHK